MRQRDSQFYTIILQIQYMFGSNTNKLYNTANAIHDSTPTSHIESKLNIIFGPIHKNILQQDQCKLRIYTNILHWSQNQYNILVQYKKKIIQKCQYYSWFAILHQHPTLKPNSIYYLVQYKYERLQQYQHDSQFYTNAILHHYTTNSIYFWIHHKQIIKKYQHNSRFYTNILH